MDSSDSSQNLSALLATMGARNKQPNSARILNSWVSQAERNWGTGPGRLGWLLASSVVTAKLQTVTDNNRSPLFLLKGGTLLQHRLPHLSRATKDLDGLVRSNLDEFMKQLDIELMKPWGPFTFLRSEPEVINVPYRVIEPQRFTISLLLQGTIWRTIPIEISPNEGSAGETFELFHSPDLEGFGIPRLQQFSGLALSYQIAQKFHAVTEPHEPPHRSNLRVRDVIDLLLLKDLVAETESPKEEEISQAAQDIFSARAQEALLTGCSERSWPQKIIGYPHWESEFDRTAFSLNISLTLAEAIELLNQWIDQLAGNK